jgi:hypothetical protein
MVGPPSLYDGAMTTIYFLYADTPCGITQGAHKGLPVRRESSRISRLFEKQPKLGGVNVLDALLSPSQKTKDNLHDLPMLC